QRFHDGDHPFADHPGLREVMRPAIERLGVDGGLEDVEIVLAGPRLGREVEAAAIAVLTEELRDQPRVRELLVELARERVLGLLPGLQAAAPEREAAARRRG